MGLSAITYFPIESFKTMPMFFQILMPEAPTFMHESIREIIFDAKSGFPKPSTEKVPRNVN